MERIIKKAGEIANVHISSFIVESSCGDYQNIRDKNIAILIGQYLLYDPIRFV